MKPFVAIAFAIGSSSVFAGLLEDIQAAEARLAAVRAQVQPLVAPLLVPDADLRVFVSLTPLATALSNLNALPAAGRTIRVQSTGRNGHLWSGGGSWCDSYVELDSSDSLRATAELTQMNAVVGDDGSIDVGARATVKGKVQVKFQLRGRRISYPWPLSGGFCPPGGGVGTSIGVELEKAQDLGILVAFAPSADRQSVGYTARFSRPTDVNVTAQIGLGAIGTIGHPFSFAIPNAPIASGTLPLLLAREGTFKLPAAGERAYAVALTPVSFSTAGKAITASWKGRVQFQAPQP